MSIQNITNATVNQGLATQIDDAFASGKLVVSITFSEGVSENDIVPLLGMLATSVRGSILGRDPLLVTYSKKLR